MLTHLTDAVAGHAAPPIKVRRAESALLLFECETWDMMLRSRVIQAFERALGPDWQNTVQPAGR